MLLAAGRGERLRPITESLPKPLVEVRGEALIERHLRSLARAGVDSAVINLGWLGGQIRERLGSGERYGVPIVYSDERDNILETAGGIHRALPLLGREPFLVVNADIYTDIPLPCRMPASLELAHLVLVPTPAFKRKGDFDIVDGKLAVAESPQYTFSGVASYDPRFFDDMSPGRAPLAPMLTAGAELGIIGASLYEGEWHDVGTPERLDALNS